MTAICDSNMNATSEATPISSERKLRKSALLQQRKNPGEFSIQDGEALKTIHSEHIVSETLDSKTHEGKWHMSATPGEDLG